MTPKKKIPPLTDDQKKFLLGEFQRTPDLNLLTQKIYGEKDDNGRPIDGRHALGRQVKKFLVENGLKYQTVKKEPTQIELSTEQKELILSEARSGANVRDIARLVFENDNINQLSSEWRTVHAFLYLECPDLIQEQDSVAGSYRPPSDMVGVARKVNAALGTKIDGEKISGKYKACFDKLFVNLRNSRFVRVCNTYTKTNDRSLFLDEFIRLTFDKPDLTADEINLYINVCVDMVNLETLRQKKNFLDEMFLSIEDASELNQRFSENLKAAVEEYNQVSKRISDVTKKLQGDRSERLKNQAKDETSFISIVQLVQDEEERKNMLRLAEMQRALITEEANRLEGLDDLFCRVMGVSQEEVI